MAKTGGRGKRFLRVVVGLGILAGVILQVDGRAYSIYGNRVEKMALKGQLFMVELADTAKKRELGLGKRRELCQSCGMLFVFPDRGYHLFWMKDMYLSLDILWLADGRVVTIKKNIPHDSEEMLSPDRPADTVLEVIAGTVERLGIEQGDNLLVQ